MNKKRILIGVGIILFSTLFYFAGGGLIWILTGLSFRKSLALFIGLTVLLLIAIIFLDSLTLD